jgi:hypothetical protein
MFPLQNVWCFHHSEVHCNFLCSLTPYIYFKNFSAKLEISLIEIILSLVGFQVFTAVVMEIAIL